MKLIGRDNETSQLKTCVKAGRNVLLEGPVGVGKTYLATSVVADLKRKVFRIDGDSRYSEQKLSGWFDPPTVMKQGFGAKAFIPGPLVEAMRAGGVLLINELNRMPEGVQNVLLPAIDEGIIQVPRLGEIEAKEGFVVIATQNPKEFVATSHLSEAILDRFELVRIDYQSEDEEIEITSESLKALAGKKADLEVAAPAVRLVRNTRGHPRFKRGASVRAAIAIAELAQIMIADGMNFKDAFKRAVQMALPTRVEMQHDVDSESETEGSLRELLDEMSEEALAKKR